MIGKQAKKIIGLALILVMTVSSYAAMPVTAESDNQMYNAELTDMNLNEYGNGIYGDFEIHVSDNNEITINKYIGSDADVTVPNSLNNMPVKEIGRHAFTGCKSLVSITISDGVEFINSGAFECSPSVKSITMPEDCTIIIGTQAFQGCSSLESIKLPNNVKYKIGLFAFWKCSSLKSITIPDSVQLIDEGAFSECSSLESITIPNSVTSIGERAFQYCSNLESITIPDSVTSIGYGAFNECLNLARVYISDIAKWCNIQFGSISASPLSGYDANLYVNNVLTKDIVIPNGVTTINSYTFRSYSAFDSVTIPRSVTSISGDSFGRSSDNTITDVYYEGTEDEWNNNVEVKDSAIQNATKHFNAVIPTVTSAVYGDKFKLRADTSLTQPLLQAADDNKVEFFIIDGENEISLGTADYIFNEDGVTGYAELEVTADKKFKIGENRIKAVYSGNANVEACESVSMIVNIKPKKLEYTVSADNRNFNSSDTVTVTLTPTGLLDGDSVTLSGTGKISDSAVGTYDKVTVSDVTLSGADAEYYTADGGTFDCNVTISEVSKTFDDESITIEAISDRTYTSKEIKPTIVVKDGDVVLKENEHYKVEYANNVNVGTADVIITGIGSYTGTKTVHFNIKKAVLVLKLSVIFGDTLNLTATTNSADGEVVSFYSGSKLIGEAKVSDGVAKLNAVADRDFVIGNNTVKAVCGDNAVELNSSGSDSMIVELSPKNISSAMLNDVEDFEYTGFEIKPEMTVTDNGEVLTSDDYDVVYSNNTSVGTATVTVKGKGYYTGSKTVEFNITGDDINVIGNSGSIADITKTDDKLIIKCTDTSVPPLTLFRAVYDEKGALKDVVIIKGTVDGDVVTFDIPSGNAKYMLWTDNNNAVMNAMNI